MQTIVLYLCYIVLILLFSTAYNTSLIYCFIIWCLHTNKRRPCSSTLSGHPSSSPYIGNSHQNWLIFFRGVETASHTKHGPPILPVEAILGWFDFPTMTYGEVVYFACHRHAPWFRMIAAASAHKQLRCSIILYMNVPQLGSTTWLGMEWAQQRTYHGIYHGMMDAECYLYSCSASSVPGSAQKLRGQEATFSAAEVDMAGRSKGWATGKPMRHDRKLSGATAGLGSQVGSFPRRTFLWTNYRDSMKRWFMVRSSNACVYASQTLLLVSHHASTGAGSFRKSMGGCCVNGVRK